MSTAFAPGDRLGRYELVRIIGGGGFASVWRARTVGPGGFERAVAVKVIRAGRANKKRFQDMLLDEARLVARIHHPNVAQIWEVGEDPRSLYYVMELVDGESLDELRMRAEEVGKTLPVRAVFRVLADVCGGLHAAHELSQDGASLGLVHRDVSPQNILVSRDGIGKLIDFGIAKAKERLAADTTTGYIKGKISFMAPEQARTEELDRRADLWAIGAVAFELLEGRPPFDAGTDIGRLAALVAPGAAPPMSDRVPAPLRAVVARTLEKDRDARYPTALALKEAIEEALIESELETSTEDVARLFEPFFHPPTTSAQPPKGIEADATQSIERPVSSTIEAPVRTNTVELPLDRRRLWPVAAIAVALAVPLGYWAFGGAPTGPSTAATGVAAPSTAPAATAGAEAAKTSRAEAPASATTAPAPPSAAASTSASGRSAASAAPRVQGQKPPRPTPTKPVSTVDENAIE